MRNNNSTKSLKPYALISMHLFFFLTSLNAYAIEGWILHNSGTTENLFAVHFLDSNTGFVTGDDIILKTTDGGLTWLTVNTSHYIFSYLFMFDSNNGLILGDGNLYRTTNGGNTLVQNTQLSQCSILKFINNNTGWCLTSNNLYTTSNGGVNWEIRTRPTGTNTDMHFVNENNGWMSTRTYIVYPHYTEYFWGLSKTIDGGSSWSGVTSGSLGTFFVTEPTVYFFDTNNGFMYTPASTSQIYKTVNGGNNWSAYNSGNFGIRDYYFSSPDTGWICGSKVRKTVDGGITWTTQLEESISSMNFLNSNTGWIVGSSGSIYKTYTGGVTSITSNSEIPNSFSLKQNYPNPFNPTTKIRFEIPHQSKSVKLSVFNSLGQEVAILVNEQLQPGIYKYDFNASDYSSGIYFYRLEANNFSETRRMVLIK